MIKVDTVVRKKWHSGFKRSVSPCILVVHGSAGPNPYKWVAEGDRLGNPRTDMYKKGIALWHYTINTTGETIEMIDPDKWVYHSSAGRADEQTIGVEMEHRDNGTTLFKDAQYLALYELIDFLMSQYPIYEIISHNKMKTRHRGKGKQCPGPGFDWDKVAEHVSEKGYSFQYTAEVISSIGKRAVV